MFTKFNLTHLSVFNKKYLFKIEKNIIFANRKIKKLAIHLPPKGRSFLAKFSIK